MTLSTRPAVPWLTVLVAACALAAELEPGSFSALSYQRPEVLAGQWWRLLSCHLSHGSAPQLLWNVATFLLLGRSLEGRLGRAYPILLGAAAATVSLGILALLPGLQSYCGLSGIVTAMFGYLLLQESACAWRAGDRLLLSLNGLGGAGLAGKLAYEYARGEALFAQTVGMVPIPAAHLLGVLAAAAVWLRSGGTRA